MNETEADGISSVEVEIFGSTFSLRGGSAPEHLRRLATLVDAKMREVAEHTATVDSTKIAVLAALNLAEELFERRGGLVGENDDATEKVTTVTDLADQLESALAD